MSVGDKFSEAEEAQFARDERHHMSEYIRNAIVISEEYKRAVIRMNKAIKAVKDETEGASKGLRLMFSEETIGWPEYVSALDAFEIEQKKLHDKIEEAIK